MNLLEVLHLDPRRGGSHYADRLHRILGTCHQMGIQSHEEKVTYRDGTSQVFRTEDVQPYVSQVGENAGKPVVRETPRYELYGLTVNPRVLVKIKGMAPQFAYALNVPNVGIDVDGDIVYIRVPKSGKTETVTFESAWALDPNLPNGHLLLGTNDEQGQLCVDLTDPKTSHAAVIGMTGSGKSTLMKSMILSAEMMGNSKVALFDPSGGFYDISGHPSVWKGGMFKKAKECAIGLEILCRAVERENPLTYIFVDEVPELVRQQPIIRDYLSKLAEMGRHGNLHLIVGAQHSLTRILGDGTVKNLPVRLVGRVADRTAAYNCTAQSESGAEKLKGAGDFLACTGESKVHFQAAEPGADLLKQWARRYPPREPRLPICVNLPPAVESHGFVGRPYEDTPKDMINWIRERHEAWIRDNEVRLASGRPPRHLFRPSLLDIERYALQHYKVGWHRGKQHRARYEALGDACTDPLDKEWFEERESAYQEEE